MEYFSAGTDHSTPSLLCTSDTSPRRNPTRIRLYCLAYAGGSAHAFAPLADSVSAVLDVSPLDYPGHGRRMREPLRQRIADIALCLADKLATSPQTPYALYGHSMGALVAYELCQLLSSRHATLPLLLIAAAHRAPHLPNRQTPLNDLPDAQLLAEIYRLDPNSRAPLETSELRTLMLPILRSDFHACETYAPRDARKLTVPIAVYGGLSDDEITRDELMAWRERTVAPCSLRFFPGGHFFMRTNISQLAWALCNDVALARNASATASL
jgi:medium-chain acyl-[acyl-carrier-protein] hydrolase